MEKITGSVGREGDNLAADVTLIQKLLNNSHIQGKSTPLKVDGKIGNITIGRIEAFQKNIINMATPDGRIDPNGKTFKKLASASAQQETATTYTLSVKATDLLKSIEALATKPYDDQTGKDITSWVEGATIGYGHLISKSEWEKYNTEITEPQALTLLKTDLLPFINKVNTAVTSSITQNEFDALVILTFNIGEAGFGSSSVLKLVNDPSADTAYPNLEAAWKAWNKSQGKVNKGLDNRRQAEWNIYANNIYKRW